MMEAFSKAKEYCEVGLWVKASNLGQGLVSNWSTSVEDVVWGQRTR